MIENAARIRAFDWLRGLAVLFMIQCHALVMLEPARRKDALFPNVDFLDGLVAPAFIFAAGFSLALVQVRGASGGLRAQRIRKTLRRLGEVLGLATFINWMWFPIFREPKWIFRMDILQCIGLGLLLALPLLAGLATRPRLLSALSLALGLVLFFVTPWFQQVHGPLAGFVNNDNQAVFPLLPWAGYVYLGAAAGAIAATGRLRVLVGGIWGLLVLGVGTWMLAPVLGRWYPPHRVSADPSEHFKRLFCVCALVLGLLAFEHFAAPAWKRMAAVRFLEAFGASSMAAYFFHEVLLYVPVLGFSFDSLWHQHFGWAGCAAVTVLLIACTFGLVWSFDKLYHRLNVRLESFAAFQRPPRANPQANERSAVTGG